MATDRQISERFTVGVMAPARALEPDIAKRVLELTVSAAPSIALRVHPQCFERHGHFAGPDSARAKAFLELANNPGVDAIWFARGGYGAGRLLEVPQRGTERVACALHLLVVTALTRRVYLLDGLLQRLTPQF